MSWVDDGLEDERKRRAQAEDDNKQGAATAFPQAKCRELWNSLRTECNERVKEYKAKCESDPSFSVTFDDATPESSFVVSREADTAAPRVSVKLRLSSHLIEVTHRKFASGDVDQSRFSFTFAYNDKGVILRSDGCDIDIARAAVRILKPVLFSWQN